MDSDRIITVVYHRIEVRCSNSVTGVEIVREIFKLCVQGYSPTQIARILTERGVDTPVVYLHKNGLPTALKGRED